MSGTSSTPASTSSQSSPAQAPPPQFDNNHFVFDIDILIICLFGLFVLFSLPRAFVRLTHGTEWANGAFLRSGSKRARNVQTPFLHQGSTFVIAGPAPVHRPRERNFDEKSFFETDIGHSNNPSQLNVNRNPSSASNVNLVRHAAPFSGAYRGPSIHYPPAHMPGWESYFPRLALLMRYPLRDDLLLGQAIILAGYLTIVLYAGFYKSNPFTEPVRAGYVAVSQLPVIIVLATKNNVAAMLLGIAYDKLNYIHRFAGLLFVLAANVHAIGYFYTWTAAGIFSETIAAPKYQAGLAALISADILAFCSTSFFRRKYYQLFIATHVIGVISILVSICFHYQDCVPYAIAGTVAYGLDRVLRVIKTRYTTARLSPLKELKTTMIELPNVGAGWKAGQHVRVRVMSSSMGILRWAENHPFTIASVGEGLNGEGLVLMCKNTGRWTNKLYDLAQSVQRGEAGGFGQEIKVLVEGPYGGPGHLMFSSFSGVLLVAGGSGITFTLGILQDLIMKDREGRSRVNTIQVIWAIQDPSAIIPLLSLLTDLLSHQTFASISISAYYTRAPTSDNALDYLSQLGLPAHLSLSPGRPPLTKNLSNVVDRACLPNSRDGRMLYGVEDERCGVIVGVCGPSGLAQQVRQVVGHADPKMRKNVGGIEVHVEAFGG